MNQPAATFATLDGAQLEEGQVFAPRFGADGLITAVAQDSASGAVLMVAHMDAAALARTIESGEAWFFSRSRGRLWKKGETSGNVLAVERILVDCDQDALVLSVSVAGHGPSCHTGRPTCFYRQVHGLGSTAASATLAPAGAPQGAPHEAG